jgi:hypothetical protein
MSGDDDKQWIGRHVRPRPAAQPTSGPAANHHQGRARVGERLRKLTCNAACRWPARAARRLTVTGADRLFGALLGPQVRSNTKLLWMSGLGSGGGNQVKFLIRRAPRLTSSGHHDRRFCWSGGWACQDLNLGPHPYQQSSAYRCASLRFRRSLATVMGQVMRSYTPADQRTDQNAAAAGHARGPIRRQQGDGAAGGRGSPIERRDRACWSGRLPDSGSAACSSGGERGQPAG